MIINELLLHRALAAQSPVLPPSGVEADQYPEAAMVCAELYQVIGSLADHFGVFEHEDVQRALDNASEHSLVHKDLLPWPRKDLAASVAGEANPIAWRWKIRLNQAWCYDDRKPYSYPDAQPLYAAPSPALDPGTVEALRRIKNYPHSGDATAQGMAAIAREALGQGGFTVEKLNARFGKDWGPYGPSATPDLGALLLRARQFVADSGCDEDDTDVNINRNKLLAEIDRALASPAPGGE